MIHDFCDSWLSKYSPFFVTVSPSTHVTKALSNDWCWVSVHHPCWIVFYKKATIWKKKREENFLSSSTHRLNTCQLFMAVRKVHLCCVRVDIRRVQNKLPSRNENRTPTIRVALFTESAFFCSFSQSLSDSETERPGARQRSKNHVLHGVFSSMIVGRGAWGSKAQSDMHIDSCLPSRPQRSVPWDGRRWWWWCKSFSGALCWKCGTPGGCRLLRFHSRELAEEINHHRAHHWLILTGDIEGFRAVDELLNTFFPNIWDKRNET